MVLIDPASAARLNAQMSLKRKLVTIFFILLGLYTFVGFLILPFLVQHFGEKALQQHVNEASQIEKVRFNPFAWKLQVEGVSAADAAGGWSIGWETAEVNLSVLTILKLYPQGTLLHVRKSLISFDETDLCVNIS
jgi:hypothetical protein